MVRAYKQHKYVDFLAVSIKNLPSAYYKKLKRLNPDLIIITWTVRTPEQLTLALENATCVSVGQNQQESYFGIMS